MEDPHAEVEIKSQLKPRGSVTKEEDPIPSHHCSTSFRLNPPDQLGRLCVYGIYTKSLRAPTKKKKKKKCTSSDSYGHWRQEHRGVGTD